MKKRIHFIMIIVLSLTLCAVGFTKKSAVNNVLTFNNKENNIINTTKKNEDEELGFSVNATEKNEQEENEEITTEKKTNYEANDLTADDKLLKEKILKYCDTKIDFRHNKQLFLQDSVYAISFSKFNLENNPTKIVYTNDMGDEFKYDIKTGELCNIKITSRVVAKTDNSIDIATAHDIALSFFPKDSNVEEYTLTVYDEAEDGYVFWYNRYIDKYETDDAFRIKVGFDGTVIYINDTTNVFDGINLDFDKNVIDNKLQEFMQKKENVDIGTVTIVVKDEKIYIRCSYTETHFNGMTAGCVVDIPLG